ncbi:hypothetical protein H0E87_001361 [Populus deltoides]|uniref:Uncharacterized protein n=1 Tax=Populus deltoides TaxID=3696 RepID=A0A8T2ZRC5_POPDE|nr:hypothetical protein H0E87_001361 [Populus deltoides]
MSTTLSPLSLDIPLKSSIASGVSVKSEFSYRIRELREEEGFLKLLLEFRVENLIR